MWPLGDGLSSGQWAAGGEVVSAIASVLTVVVAVLAAWYARSQVDEARRSREEQAQPFVVVDVQPSPVWRNALNLVVENVGRTLAKDVRFTFDPPLRTTQTEYPITESVLVREGIRGLPPGRRVEGLYDLSHQLLNSGLPLRYEVSVTFSDARGRKQEPLDYVIDLNPLFGLLRFDEKGVHHVAKALEGIDKRLGKWSGQNGLRVWNQDADRDALDDRVEHSLTGRYPSLAAESPPELLMALGRNVVLRTVWRNVRQAVERRRNHGADNGG